MRDLSNEEKIFFDKVIDVYDQYKRINIDEPDTVVLPMFTLYDFTEILGMKVIHMPCDRIICYKCLKLQFDKAVAHE